jgi:hypothetical protein
MLHLAALKEMCYDAWNHECQINCVLVYLAMFLAQNSDKIV